MTKEPLPPAHDHPDAQGMRRAAVLAGLHWQNDQWQLLLIRRAKNERDRHSGQVAFPGGRAEPHDASSEATALREAEEEIGLPHSHVQVLGKLRDYTTISNYSVSPIVGVIHRPFEPVLQTTEVSRVFSIPLNWLSEPHNYRHEEWSPERPKVVFFNPWDGETLWGATAAMTLHLLHAIEQRDIILPR